VGGWEKGWGGGVDGGLRLPFSHNGTSCVPKEPSHGPQPYYKAKHAVW